MLNLDPNNAVRYTNQQKQAISNLINNRGQRTGKELWDEKGPNGIFDDVKDDIRQHNLEIQKARCAFCEDLLQYGGVHIEHFANKGRYQQFIYEPLNLVCSCPVCNGFAKKGSKDTIVGSVNNIYSYNNFKYVHPYLDNVSNEIKYKDLFRLIVDRDRSSDKGKATIDMFHWDTLHATFKRLSNLIVRPTTNQRREIIAEILNNKG